MNLHSNQSIVFAFHGKELLETEKVIRLKWLQPTSYFMDQLRREKRRTDRSKIPLSIAYVYLEENKCGELSNIKEILNLLQNSIRETDIIGCLNEDVIGIIFPDTDEERAQEFKKRIIKGVHKDLAFSIITETYPNQIVHGLLEEPEIPYTNNLIKGNLEASNQMDLKLLLYTTTDQPVNLLSKSYFLEQLRREKRRADRSNIPVSIALFYPEKNKSGELSNIKEILELLQNSIRETDIIGSLGDNIIGIILTDTDEERTQEFKKRIIKGAHEDLAFSIITETYPNQIFYDLLIENPNQSDSYPLFLNDSKETNQLVHSLKRMLDVIGALLGIMFFSPVMLITALAIKGSSPGPVIFKQIRLGKKGIPFVFYKFRSMHHNTDDQIHRQYITHLIQGNLEKINQGDEEKPLYKIKSDPRVTRVGRIIRKTSIDELPQLFNVLKGEMSLVGPRPPLPYEVEKYQSWHLRRVLEMKPGITGLWQVNGRSETSFDDMVRLDIRYIRSWSLMLDIKILVKTVKAVLHSAGAF